MTGLLCVSLVFFYCYQGEPLIHNSQARIFRIHFYYVYGLWAVFRADI